jgi:hypothetical protein
LDPCAFSEWEIPVPVEGAKRIKPTVQVLQKRHSKFSMRISIKSSSSSYTIFIDDPQRSKHLVLAILVPRDDSIHWKKMGAMNGRTMKMKKC